MHRSVHQPGIPALGPSFPGTQPDGLSNEAMLHHLIAGLTEVSVILLDADGRVLRCTALTASRLGFSSPDDIIGRLLTDIAPEDWAFERVQWIRRTIELGTTTTMLSIMHGKRMRTTYSPIRLSPERGVVLVTVEQISPERFDELRELERDDETLVIGQINNLGKLDVLSSRELEVLALLGQGMRPKDIANLLHRSLSTIDGHRERIGEKLGIRDRAELMSIARIAALQVDDADRARIHITPANNQY